MTKYVFLVFIIFVKQILLPVKKIIKMTQSLRFICKYTKLKFNTNLEKRVEYNICTILKRRH